MEIEIVPISGHTYLIDLDDVATSAIHQLGYSMRESKRDILQLALENGLTVLKLEQLQKES